MDGYRKSFQYIQDYININSLKIWHEEVRELYDYTISDISCTKMFSYARTFYFKYAHP